MKKVFEYLASIHPITWINLSLTAVVAGAMINTGINSIFAVLFGGDIQGIFFTLLFAGGMVGTFTGGLRRFFGG